MGIPGMEVLEGGKGRAQREKEEGDGEKGGKRRGAVDVLCVDGGGCYLCLCHVMCTVRFRSEICFLFLH